MHILIKFCGNVTDNFELQKVFDSVVIEYAIEHKERYQEDLNR